MKEPSWQGILQGQQQDFIQRLKYYLCVYPQEADVVFLNRLISNHYCKLSYHSELISILFDCEQEEEIHNFCLEIFNKFNLEYHPDDYMNNKIGKIGEEAINVCLGDLVTKVDYKIYERGDQGIDLLLINNQSIGIQIKTKTLNRITFREIDKYKLNNYDVNDTELQLHLSASDRIDNITWSISEKEIATNTVLICVLILNSIAVDQIEGNSYDCVIAGFKPTREMKNAQSLTMKSGISVNQKI
ncbi:MAG: hypothetical protein SAK29_08760 [Scytonema sp. PMC 1069.18]|nr:hypothetical protein [Scytonema sp. PMC 1069.18]MEC4884575.1 hypothetical protein [Scytonema sp. PMC 1070.18]